MWFLLRDRVCNFILAVCATFFILVSHAHAETSTTQNVEQRQPRRLQFDDYLQPVIKEQNQWFDQFFSDRFFQSSRDHSADMENVHKRISDALQHSPLLSPAIRHLGQN